MTSTHIRPAAVAGLFYPGDPESLRAAVAGLLGESPAGGQQAPPVPKVLVVPHAGLVYSGPVAAEAYRLLEPQRSRISRVAIFGPAHRVPLEGLALSSADAFATPLGTVPVDHDAQARIAALRGVTTSDTAHAQEHSLEVQLPFLQVALADFCIVPVVVGHAAPRDVARVIDALWGGDETLIVVSSDLSHYLDYEHAQQADRRTCRRILDRQTNLSGYDACGAFAINGLLEARHARGLDIDLIDLRNSGDTAGDRDRVVGYGAFSLH